MARRTTISAEIVVRRAMVEKGKKGKGN